MRYDKIPAIIFAAAAAVALSSCSDAPAPEPLATPVVTPVEVSYSSLSFSWEPVAGAVQYGYRLSDDSDETPIAGVTQGTSVVFSSLKPATHYTLDVWAFAAIGGDYSTPPAYTLSATTDALIKLATPQLTLTEDDGTVKTNWEAVEDAESYDYRVVNAKNEEYKTGSTKKTALVFRALPPGDYTFYLTATTSVGGYEDSETASATFSIARKESWRVTGTYYSIALDASWPATMIAYNNSTYTILAFYGVEGYNLEFAVDESNTDDMFSIINGELYNENGWKSWLVPTGVADPDTLWTYPWKNYCLYYGDASSGEVSIGLYYGENLDWGFDTFTW